MLSAISFDDFNTAETISREEGKKTRLFVVILHS